MDSIVDYDSSSSEEDQDRKDIGLKRSLPEDRRTSKRQALPKLPTFFSPIVPHDSVDYQGRVRSKPAVMNNWATHVYLQVKPKDTIGAVVSLVLTEDVRPVDSPHISLSKCLYLKEHETPSYASAIRDALKSTKSFVLSFAQLALLTNEDKTRSFLTAEIGRGYQELTKCMEAVDRVNKKFNQPLFYQPPRFHASIAWSLKESSIEKALDKIPEELITSLRHEEIVAAMVYVKSGDRLVACKLE
ncbi:hypothetical protein DM01DRAFT_1179687 [Hesseltinella vesiculosa]|uniref:U6 snRNA phosphodiesterase 1 n=1 Tax=Hesseltinella vesiculosa TaxID=101127 RepID=A0A1X2G4B2_9FUNG|nr:hypothetical protein DM01DRAFT_1179687 [Hesseltinella vesiculosa]